MCVKLDHRINERHYEVSVFKTGLEISNSYRLYKILKNTEHCFKYIFLNISYITIDISSDI